MLYNEKFITYISAKKIQLNVEHCKPFALFFTNFNCEFVVAGSYIMFNTY